MEKSDYLDTISLFILLVGMVCNPPLMVTQLIMMALCIVVTGGIMSWFDIIPEMDDNYDMARLSLALFMLSLFFTSMCLIPIP